MSVPIDTSKKFQGKRIPYNLIFQIEVMYNPEYKILKWVKYEFAPSETDGLYSKKTSILSRSICKRSSGRHDDYRNSGWSKGYMAPVADFKRGSQAIIVAFYFTNCCPQNQS